MDQEEHEEMLHGPETGASEVQSGSRRACRSVPRVERVARVGVGWVARVFSIA